QSISLDTSQFLTVPDSLRDGLVLPIVTILRMRQSQELTPGIYGGVSSQNQAIFGLEGSYTNRNLFNAADNFNAHLTFQFWPWLTKETRASFGGQFIMPYVFWQHVPFIFSGYISYAEIKEK